MVAPRSVDFKLEAVSSRLKGELIHPNKRARIYKIDFSPDGRRIVASDYPGSMVVVWDVATGKRLTTIETGTMNYAISPDWKTLFAPHMKTRRIERVEQDGKRMMRWSFDSEVRAWRLDDGKLRRTYKHQPPRGIHWIQLSPDGTRLVTYEGVSGIYERSSQGSCTLWDVKSGKYRTLADEQMFGTFTPDGRSFTYTLPQKENNHDRAMKLIDVASGQEKWSIPMTGKGSSVRVQAVSREGKVFFGGLDIYDDPQKWDNWRSWMKWWDAATGREIASFEGERNGGFCNFCSSPDGQLLAALNSRGDARKLFLFSVAEKRLLRTVLLCEKTEQYLPLACGLTFSPDGKWLAVITRFYREKENENKADPRDRPQPHILLIEAATGVIRERIISPQAFALAACFSPDGRTLATGGHGRILLWDMTKMPQ